MRERRFGAVRRTSIAVCLTAVAIAGTRCVAAEEQGHGEQIRQLILQLADKDDAVRQKAVDEMVRSRDGRLAGLLNSYTQGNLYLWMGRPVIGEQAEADAKGKRRVVARSLIAGARIAGRQAGRRAAARSQGSRASAEPARRSTDAVQALGLWSNDFEKRISAIQRRRRAHGGGEHAGAEEIAKADPSAKIRRAARESIDLIRLSGSLPQGTEADRLEAARDLGTLHSARGRAALAETLDHMDKDATAGKPPDAAARDRLSTSDLPNRSLSGLGRRVRLRQKRSLHGFDPSCSWRWAWPSLSARWA